MSKVKNPISKEILEKLYGKLICIQTFQFNDEASNNIFNDNKPHTMTFQLYDGFGYCPNYKGSEVVIKYPTLDFVSNCDTMAQSIREFNGLNDEDEITVPNIVHSYVKLEKI